MSHPRCRICGTPQCLLDAGGKCVNRTRCARSVYIKALDRSTRPDYYDGQPPLKMEEFDAFKAPAWKQKQSAKPEQPKRERSPSWPWKRAAK